MGETINLHRVISHEHIRKVEGMEELNHIAPIGYLTRRIERSHTYPSLYIAYCYRASGDIYYVHMEDMREVTENEDWAAALLKEI